MRIENPKAKLGELRLYFPDRIVDVVPRMGRVVIFKSEAIEHEVRPTLGYDRYAATVWFNQVVTKAQPSSVFDQQFLSDDYSIFIGIPSYRDS